MGKSTELLESRFEAVVVLEDPRDARRESGAPIQGGRRFERLERPVGVDAELERPPVGVLLLSCACEAGELELR